ncbi:MAG: arginine--tRNA ligase [Alphaproteobacteria bacterium]
MNVFNQFRDHILKLLEGLAGDGLLPPGLDTGRVAVEPPREAGHGDLASNAAMVLAKPAGRKPRELAALIASKLEAMPEVTTVEIAGPGFINLTLSDGFWHARLSEMLEAGAGYGLTDLGQGRRINVEYVSANPTGPLHVGHGRGAVFGDALANLLEAVGFDVTREYYINDAGAQLEALGRSVYYRYQEARGQRPAQTPDGFYPGDYLVPVGQALAERDRDKWLKEPERDEEGKGGWMDACSTFGRDEMMKLIKADLKELGIRHEKFSSERLLFKEGKIQHAVDELERRGLIYTGVLEPPKGKPPPDDWEPREQLLFRATRFGDDTDRPLQKSDGGWAYFDADIAYHLDKFERGFATMIDVWGADHGGYVKRMKAAVKAVTDGQGELDIKICQLVNLFERGKPYRMSKRAGTFVTLREVVDAVGKDVVRFMMLTRKNDAPLDFDLAKVTEQSKDNPVFYVQYAHARIRSVMRKVLKEFPDLDISEDALKAADLGLLTDSSEIALMKSLAAWPRAVQGAAAAHEPHRVAFYLYDLASAFHLHWSKGNEDPKLRIIVTGDRRLTLGRLALIGAVASVIANGLAIFGVEPVEEMR